MSGEEIAEWVMNNRASLNLKYVIWGQRIWNPSMDSVKPWKSWRPMEDRHSITQNHWYVINLLVGDGLRQSIAKGCTQGPCPRQLQLDSCKARRGWVQ